MWILSAATLVNRSGTMVLAFLVLYVTHTLGVSPARAALALMVYGVAALLAMPLAGILSDRVGPLPIMKASLFLTGFLLLLFPLAKSYNAILVMTFGFAVLNESLRLYPPVTAGLVRMTPREGSMIAGQSRTFTAQTTIDISAKDGGALLLELNGQTLAPLGPPGQPGNITLTRGDLKPSGGGAN